jgi:transposase
MESTGVYWKPISNILEDDFKIILVNARHVHQIPGHKTDKKDSKWLCKLLLAGLLKGSFIPPRKIRELRDLFRYKTKLIHQRTQEKNRILKILEDANIKLSSVLTDVFGATGTEIINAILDGEQDPKKLSAMAKGTAIHKISQIEESVNGKITEHHKFMLRTIKTSIEGINKTIKKINKEIDAKVKPHEAQIKQLDTIPGVDREGAIGIIAEIGVDMERFPDSQQLASYAGVCPGNNESAGKKKSSRINKGNLNLKELLVQLAWAAIHTKNTYLSAKYKSLVGRLGKKRALIAIGHKIIIASYFILNDGVDFKELGVEHLDNLKKDKIIKYHLKRIRELGVDIEIKAS